MQQYPNQQYPQQGQYPAPYQQPRPLYPQGNHYPQQQARYVAVQSHGALQKQQRQQAQLDAFRNAPSGHTLVYTYANTSQVQQGVAVMSQYGYRVVAQMSGQRNPGCLSIFMLGLFARPKTTYTVTFTKN